MLSHYLTVMVFTVIIAGRCASDKAHSLSSEFSAATLATSQLCEDEWFMCELQSSGW